MSITQLDRYRGALLGLATGDALGTTLEFRPPGTFNPISDMVGGGPFNLKPGQWTDDTSMALCLAESLVEQQGFDLTDQLNRYVRWYRSGYLSSTGHCFDIGNTIRQALHQFEQTGNPYCGLTDPHSAGNGSIMRLAPVPLAYAWQPALAIKKSAESSRTTHATQAAVDGCRYLGALLVGAVNGETKEALLSSRYSPIPGYWESNPLTPVIDKIAAGSFKTLSPPAIKGSGYVVDSLEAALWAFWHSNSFREGCLMAINLGDDADTTGAVYGQLAGAYHGASGIPATWRSQLALGTVIKALAAQLLELRQQEPD
jgi:ADP-ribosylglycohydrolase